MTDQTGQTPTDGISAVVASVVAAVSARPRAVTAAVVVLAGLTIIGFLALGANQPADPSLGPPAGPSSSATEGRQPLAGFGETGFRITDASGSVFDGCALLAVTPEAHARGLMEQFDLRGYDAMVFSFSEATNVPFYNRNVPVDLSVAWFDIDGRFVADADMAACEDADGCPTAGPPEPYLTAVEVLAGGLERLGIGAGSTVALTGGCSSA